MSDSLDKPKYDRIRTRHYFAGEHLRAAQLMAKRCTERELLVLEIRGGELPAVDSEVRSYAVCAIAEAVAFLEARVNEVWQAAQEPKLEMASQRLAGLDDSQTDAVRTVATECGADRLGIFEKLDSTLFGVAGQHLQKGRRPGQDVYGLIKLRNALIHFKVEPQWDDETHKLEKQLRHLLPPNPLLQGAKPWFPHHVLCAGVA